MLNTSTSSITLHSNFSFSTTNRNEMYPEYESTMFENIHIPPWKTPGMIAAFTPNVPTPRSLSLRFILWHNEPSSNQPIRHERVIMVWISNCCPKIVMRACDFYCKVMNHLQMKNTWASYNGSSLELPPKLWWEPPIHAMISLVAIFKWRIHDERVIMVWRVSQCYPNCDASLWFILLFWFDPPNYILQEYIWIHRMIIWNIEYCILFINKHNTHCASWLIRSRQAW